MDKVKQLNQKDKEYFLSLKPEDITAELLNDLFAYKLDTKTNTIKPPKFDTGDYFTLKANEYFNKTEIKTNCGLFIINKFVLEGARLTNAIEYINTPFDKKTMGKLNGNMSTALLEDKITPDQFYEFTRKLSWLAFVFNTQVSDTFTLSVMTPIPKVEKRKKELLEKNKEELSKGNTTVSSQIEDELVKLATEELKDDSALSLYLSGARGTMGNAYKNSMIMKGPIYNSAKGSFEVVESSLTEGLNKKDLPVMANSVIAATYPKAIGTAVGGYLSKQLSAAFQGVILGPKGSDCGCSGYSEFVLTEDASRFYSYRYILEGGKLVLLTPDTIKKYIGKTIKLRSPMYCTSKHLCNVCAGDLYYMLGISNVGLTVARASNSAVNLSMKKFHDLSIKSYGLTTDEIFM